MSSTPSTTVTPTVRRRSAVAARPDPVVLLAEALHAVTAAARALDLQQPMPELRPPRVIAPGEALLDLIEGRASAGQAELGVPVADGRIIVIRGAEDILRRLHALAPPLNRAVDALRGGEWIVFMPGVPRTSGVDSGDRDSRRLLQHLQRCGIRGWCAGVSSAVKTGEDFPKAHRDASDAVCLVEADGGNEVSVDDEWARLTVARLRAVAREALPLRSPLDLLAEYDRTHNTTLSVSLSAWLEANADMRAAASALRVHANTLRYRVRRAAEVAGLDLDDPLQRLVLLLAGTPGRALGNA